MARGQHQHQSISAKYESMLAIDVDYCIILYVRELWCKTNPLIPKSFLHKSFLEIIFMKMTGTQPNYDMIDKIQAKSTLQRYEL